MSTNPSATLPGHHCFAEFVFRGSPDCLVRKDTRVYYHPQNPAAIVRADGRCVGVIWMCNPGSAGGATDPTPWQTLPPDPTLRAVLALYQRAVAAKDPAVVPGLGDFILVMNCFYAVSKDHTTAYAQWVASDCHYRERIPKKASFVVAAWGADKPQGPVWRSVRAIQRFRKKRGSSVFVVYINAPSLRANQAQLSSRLAVMNYPLHPLNRLFAGSPPDLAAALAAYV